MDGQELNPTSASILGFLRGGPMSGYDLAAEIDGSIGYFWNVTRSQLYRELKTLAQRKFVALSKSGVRDRRTCTITAAGRKAFAQWIAREPEAELIRFPLLLTLFFGDAVDRSDLEQWLARNRDAHERRLARYKSMRPQVRETAPFPALTLDFGIEYESAVLRWLEKLTLPLQGV